jgi:ABC-type polysaccharide transport system permease subunit
VQQQPLIPVVVQAVLVYKVQFLVLPLTMPVAAVVVLLEKPVLTSAATVAQVAQVAAVVVVLGLWAEALVEPEGPMAEAMAVAQVAQVA